MINIPKTWLGRGHVEYNIKKAVELGLDPIIAIQIVAINIVLCFRMSHLIGSMAPRCKVGLVIIKNIEKLVV